MGTTRTRTFSALALAVVGTACLLGLGAATPATGQQNSAFGTDTNFAVSFKGGSIESFVNALRDASGDVPVNVIVSGQTDGLQLPPIMLEHVDVKNAVRSLKYLSVDPYVIDVGMTDEGAANGVMSIAVHKRVAQRQQPGMNVIAGQPDRLEVISLTELLEGAGDDGASADTATLLTAIDTALAMAGDTQAAELKFHPDSRLLIIRGSDRQADLVKRLINEVYQDVTRRRSITHQLRAELRQAEIEAQKADVTVQASRDEFEMARAELDQLKKLHASGMVGDGELRGAERQIQQMQSHMEIAELERQQRMERLHTIADQLKAVEAKFAAPTTEEAIKAEVNRLRTRIRELENRLNQLNSGRNRAQ